MHTNAQTHTSTETHSQTHVPQPCTPSYGYQPIGVQANWETVDPDTDMPQTRCHTNSTAHAKATPHTQRCPVDVKRRRSTGPHVPRSPKRTPKKTHAHINTRIKCRSITRKHKRTHRLVTCTRALKSLFTKPQGRTPKHERPLQTPGPS